MSYKYIGKCTTQGLPPRREVLQSFASAAAKWEVSERWVSRFLHRHADKLTIRVSSVIDHDRHKADLKERYELYFRMLHDKTLEYGVEPENTYNMDEKGFAIGVTNCSKGSSPRRYGHQKRAGSPYRMTIWNW